MTFDGISFPDEPLPYARQCIEEDDIEAVGRALRSNLIARGPKVAEFEEHLARQCRAPYAVAFSSGSTALLAACLALNAGPRDRALIPANSFVATASCAALLDCSIEFVDVDSQTGNLDLKSLASCLKRRGTGRDLLIAVHFAGRALDIAEIAKLDPTGRLLILEDAAHALGSSSVSEVVGSCNFSACCAFSFHAVKNITAGEGGAVTTRSKSLARELRRLRNSGIEREKEFWRSPSEELGYYEVQRLSSNFHLTEMQAALGISQLGKIERFRLARAALIERYRKRLSGLRGLSLPPFSEREISHFHLFFVLIDFCGLKGKRCDLANYLQTHNIGSRALYIPLYRHPCWPKGVKTEPLVGSEKFYSQIVALPLFAQLKLQEVDWICHHVIRWLRDAEVRAR